MRNTALGFAVASALAFGVAVPAKATINSTLTDYWNSLGSSWTSLVGQTVTGSYTVSNPTDFGNGYVSLVDTVYSWQLAISKAGQTFSALGSAWAQSSSGYLTFNGNQITPTTNFAVDSNVKVESVSASITVPGPVAAAGLPAALIGLIGYGLYRRRTATAA